MWMALQLQAPALGWACVGLALPSPLCGALCPRLLAPPGPAFWPVRLCADSRGREAHSPGLSVQRERRQGVPWANISAPVPKVRPSAQDSAFPRARSWHSDWVNKGRRRGEPLPNLCLNFPAQKYFHSGGIQFSAQSCRLDWQVCTFPLPPC